MHRNVQTEGQIQIWPLFLANCLIMVQTSWVFACCLSAKLLKNQEVIFVEIITLYQNQRHYIQPFERMAMISLLLHNKILHATTKHMISKSSRSDLTRGDLAFSGLTNAISRNGHDLSWLDLVVFMTWLNLILIFSHPCNNAWSFYVWSLRVINPYSRV